MKFFIFFLYFSFSVCFSQTLPVSYSLVPITEHYEVKLECAKLSMELYTTQKMRVIASKTDEVLLEFLKNDSVVSTWNTGILYDDFGVFKVQLQWINLNGNKNNNALAIKWHSFQLKNGRFSGIEKSRAGLVVFDIATQKTYTHFLNAHRDISYVGTDSLKLAEPSYHAKRDTSTNWKKCVQFSKLDVSKNTVIVSYYTTESLNSDSCNFVPLENGTYALVSNKNETYFAKVKAKYKPINKEQPKEIVRDLQLSVRYLLRMIDLMH